MPVAAALALAVPGSFGAAQVTLAAAGVTAWSLISLILPRRESSGAIGFFTATAVVGVGVLLAAGASSLWQLPLVSLGCRSDSSWRCWSPSKLRNCPRCGPDSRCRSFRRPVTPPRRRRPRGCSRTCRDGSGSATRTRPDSSPAPYCSA